MRIIKFFKTNEHIQVTLLEGREACEIKLKSPLKFWSGRSDCVSSDENGRGYMAAKEEVQPRMMGDARLEANILEEFFPTIELQTHH